MADQRLPLEVERLKLELEPELELGPQVQVVPEQALAVQPQRHLLV